MIGRPLEKINHIALADDYNKVVEVLRPYQNLTFGTGLNGVISQNGISLSLTPNMLSFDFPFKVTNSYGTELNVQFGRVFESVIGTGLTELSCDVTFDTTSGLTLDATDITSDAILIAINKITESEPTYNRFTIGFGSIIDFDQYFTAQVIANFTQDNPGVFNIEQVAGYDLIFTQGTGGGSEPTSGTPEREEDLTTDKPYPFQTVPLSSNDGCQVYLGRVFEYNAFSSSETADKINPFAELSETNAVNPGTWISLGNPGAEKTVVVARTSTLSDNFYLTYEEDISTGEYIIARIARVYTDGGVVKVEQIHMGDVSWSEHTIAPFTVVRFGETIIAYIPANSVVLNGIDYTSQIVSLPSPVFTDWYHLNDLDQTSIFIRMSNSPNYYGKVSEVEINTYTTPPAYDGETIMIPIYNPSTRRNIQIGAINREIIRTDTGDWAGSSDPVQNSIVGSATGLGYTGDRTMSLHGFSTNEGLNGNLSYSNDGWDHSFAVREHDINSSQVFLRWAPYSDLVTAVEESLEDDGWNTDITDELTSDFFNWYDGLSGIPELSGRGFWEKGNDESTNYGSAIGDSNSDKVIDLDTKTLIGDPWSFDTLSGDTVLAGYVEAQSIVTPTLAATTLILSGYVLTLNPDGTVRWS